MSIKQQLHQPGRGKKITGQEIDALERFAEDTRHMIVFDVLTWDCPVGDKSERVRIFLTVLYEYSSKKPINISTASSCEIIIL